MTLLTNETREEALRWLPYAVRDGRARHERPSGEDLARHEIDIFTSPASAAAVSCFRVEDSDPSPRRALIGRALASVSDQLTEAGVTGRGPALVYYAPLAGGFDVAAGFRVPLTSATFADLDLLMWGETEVAHTTHHGAHGRSRAYADLRRGAELAGRRIKTTGPMWEEYSVGSGTSGRTRIEIYCPLVPVFAGYG